MPINPYTDEEEDDTFNLADSDLQPQPTSPLVNFPSATEGIVPDANAPQAMDPMVKDHIMKKYNLGDYSDENRKKLIDDNSGYDVRGSIGAALMALGGGNGAEALKGRQAERQRALDAFDKGRANKIQENTLNRDEEKFQRESDPTSIESKMAQDLAKSMGYTGDVTGLSAQKFKDFSPIMAKKYDIEEKRLDRKEARDERRYESGMRWNDKKDEKKKVADEKVQKLTTPYGIAITEKDADTLKKAGELKQAFDDQIDSVIALREKHGGGAVGPDAKIGEDLSSQLIQSYDSLAKETGMSRVGAANIKKLVPEDPLQFRGPGEVFSGRDTTLESLKHLKNQTDKSFKNVVSGRTRPGTQQMSPMASDSPAPHDESQNTRNIVKTQTGNKGTKKIFYDDGSVETIPATASR